MFIVMNKLTLHGLAALVIIGLGGYLFWQYGQKQYYAGYDKCMYDGAVLATEAAKDLNDVIRKSYKTDDVINKLRINNELRAESDF